MDFNKVENPLRVFVIGFIGSDRLGRAKELAESLGYRLVDMDAVIAKRDGRSIKRLCMTMGEHEYRNKEYELLQELASQTGIVAACGDGILLDDMNFEVLQANPVVFQDTPPDKLWLSAKEDEEIPYAFLSGEKNENTREKFYDLYHARLWLYNQCVK